MSLNKPKQKSKTKVRPPNLPQHNLPDPYSRLQTLGEGDFENIYDTVANTLREGDAEAAVSRLIQMIQDDTYYEYDEDETFDDPRGWTRLHALRVLMHMGNAAKVGIEPLLVFLDEEDDYVREELPFYYAEMGQDAIEPLARIVRNHEKETFLRGGASESLAEIGEKIPELRPVIIPLLEEALLLEEEDATFAALLIINLLDLGSQESLPVIEKAFEEDRVDESVIGLADVQEHFHLPITAERPTWDYLPPDADRPLEIDEMELLTANVKDKTPTQPYVATNKTGRNDPCPCGSGKKYKKCCGAE